MVILEELDENNNIIVKDANVNIHNNKIHGEGQNIFPFPGVNPEFLPQQQVPIFIPNMMPQFPGMPFSFNIQMNSNAPPQSIPPNMFMFRPN